MALSDGDVTLQVGDRAVVVTHPDKLLIPQARVRKLDLVDYYLAIAEGALRGAGGRPCMLVRYPEGIDGDFFFQKRAPGKRPAELEVTAIRFPSGRAADEVVPRRPADLAWLANLACLELHPHPVRADDLEHPDELRIDLDPVPGVTWPQIQQVARVVREALAEVGLTGWPKTSGSRGVHVLIRIERRWNFVQVRRAAPGPARGVGRRAPDPPPSGRWEGERHRGFIDYNQNAKDRTVCSAYSVRPKPDARVSTPVSWQELDECDPADFTLWTLPGRWQSIGDPHAAIDDHAGSLESLLELSARHEAEGRGDAPWPPHYRKAAGEPKRKPPSGRHGNIPLIEIARVEREADALAAAEAWKAAHPKAAGHLDPHDVLIDRMRGSSSLWYRVRINLVNVPPALRPDVPKPG